MTVPGGYGQPPSSLTDYYASVEQGSNRRFDTQIAQQAKQEKAKLDNAYRVAKLQASTQAEQTAVDRWYKQQQVALAQKTFDESVRQFDKTYGLQEADTTGWFGAKPTLAREQQEFQQGVTRGQLTGEYGGQPTLEARELERKYGLAAGELTGIFNGTATAAERERIARLGITQGELMGVYNGQQTQAAREAERRLGMQEGELTGTYQGRQTEAGRQFDQRLGLEQQQFGLNVAQTAAEMRSRPDMLFQYQQFAQNLPGLLAGQGGAPQTQGAPAGQTIPGQLAEVGYLQPAAGQPAAPGAPGAPAAPTAAPLSDQEQARWQQLMARHLQIRASGGPGLEGADLDEARRFEARGAVFAAPPTPGVGPPNVAPTTGGSPASMTGGSGGYMVQGPTGEWQQVGGLGAGAGSGWQQGPGGPPGSDDGMRYALGAGDGGARGNAMTQLPDGSFGAYGAGWGGGGSSSGSGSGSWFTPYADWGKAQAGGPSADMAYLSAASPTSANPTLAAIGKTYQRGFQHLGAQNLERMDKNELGFLRSGGSYMGYDMDRELRKYAGSRLGQ